jgi:hypothetical protein
VPVTETNAEIVQGSEEWRALRLGKITASRFSDVLTQPKTKADRVAGKLSQTADSYMLEVLAEHLTGEDQSPPPTWAMKRGTAVEPDARDLYSYLTGMDVEEVGFWTHHDEPMIGGSPDGLVGTEGGIEIKCPANTRIHLGYMLGGVLPKDHIAQVQGHMWLGRRPWWDFVSYDPRITDKSVGHASLPLALWVHRVYRDEPYITKLQQAVFAFRDRLLETLCELKLKTGE